MNQEIVTKIKIARLIAARKTGLISIEENAELNRFLEEEPEYRNVFFEIMGRENTAGNLDVTAEDAWLDLLSRYPVEEKKQVFRSRRVILKRIARVAAVFIIGMLPFLYLYKSYFTGIERIDMALIQPGGSKATLTLPDGREIALEEGYQGEIEEIALLEESGKVLNYTPGIGDKSEYHTLTTPRGGEYIVSLSDGSKVYLNAETQLVYPVVFDSLKREIHLSGEAYFEVSPESDRPFYVVAKGVRIRVYGTSFNVNTHRDDCIHTVLVSGSIGIRGDKEDEETVIRPGQLVSHTATGELIEIKETDVYPHIAWRKGEYVFERETLESIMNSLALWYDVNVYFLDPEIKDHRFTGHVKKYENIDGILNAMSSIIGINFKVEGKTIILMK